jgi:hypothetical protein
LPNMPAGLDLLSPGGFPATRDATSTAEDFRFIIEENRILSKATIEQNRSAPALSTTI